MNQETGRPVKDALELYREAVREWDSCLKNDGEVPKEVVSRAFRCAHLVLRAYCLPSNWESPEAPREHVPIELAHLIANQIGYIVSGKCPDPIKDLTPIIHDGRRI